MSIQSKFEKKQINKLEIERQYTLKSEPILVDFGSTSDVLVNIKGLNNLRQVSKLSEIKTVSSAHPSMSSILNISDNDSVRWDLILGKHHSKKYASSLHRNIAYSTKLITSYYVDGVYKKRVRAYQNLDSVILEGAELETPVYNHNSTTGRTSIVSGTNFLTMSKEKRKLLKHKDDNMVLVEIDFKSCEPTFYLKALGRDIESEDVYRDIAKNINVEIEDRARFKRGVLSVMYGARDTTSKNILRCSFSDLDRIKKYFEIDAFKDYLKDHFEKEGLIYNYYGRPICYDTSLVNYWIQSSAVDYCSLAFSKLIKDLDVKPCFYVHDSVTVAVHKNRMKEIMSLKSAIDDYSGIEIPIEVCPLAR